LDDLGRRAQHCLSRRADRARERLELTVCRWPQPQALFAPAAQRVDEVGDRLPRALAARAAHARAELNTVSPRLRPALLGERVVRASEKLSSLWRLAELAHPERPLTRGFVRVTDRKGATLSKVADAAAAKLLSLHFADGELDAIAGAEPALRRPVERKPRSSYVAPQPGLFDEAGE
jgi:exodeoxyribonuclease VII large subunit